MLCLMRQADSVKVYMLYKQVLAKKMIAIMELSQQQLSKQDHYDYGLRSFVIPIARAAGEHAKFTAPTIAVSVSESNPGPILKLVTSIHKTPAANWMSSSEPVHQELEWLQTTNCCGLWILCLSWFV